MAVDFGLVGLFIGLVGILVLLGWVFRRKQVEPDIVQSPPVIKPDVPNDGIIVVPNDPIYKPEIDDPKEEPKEEPKKVPEKVAPKKEPSKPKAKPVPKKYTPRPRKK